MKGIVLLAIVAISLSVSAQTVVHKPVTLLKIAGGQKPIQFQRVIIEKDTSYQVMFRNIAYQELVDVKYLPIPKRYLSGFYNAMADALALKIGDTFQMPEYSIEKLRTGAVGTVHYWLHYDNGYCQLTEKDIKDLQNVISKEL